MLAKVAASAAELELVASPRRFVDFSAHFPKGHRTDVAGYVMRRIQCDKPHRIRVFTGSDDALRVWLNDELVTSVLALRGAKRDSESNLAELRAGTNTLIAEVSQAGGGWGLYMRFEDERGNDLSLTDNGRLRRPGG